MWVHNEIRQPHLDVTLSCEPCRHVLMVRNIKGAWLWPLSAYEQRIQDTTIAAAKGVQ